MQSWAGKQALLFQPSTARPGMKWICPAIVRRDSGAGGRNPATETGRIGKMRVSEAMTRDVFIIDPEETIQQAALAMAGIDAGALPVADKDRLVGMITDRDIAIRGVAEGK